MPLANVERDAMGDWTAGAGAPGLPTVLGGPAHLAQRHVDAERGAVLARAPADGFAAQAAWARDEPVRVRVRGFDPFGSLLVGSVAEKSGVPAACAIGGGCGVLLVLLLAFHWRHQRRRGAFAPVESP
jgi:hypothetical protein